MRELSFNNVDEGEADSWINSDGCRTGAFLFSQAVIPLLLNATNLEHPPTLIFTGMRYFSYFAHVGLTIFCQAQPPASKAPQTSPPWRQASSRCEPSPSL